MKKNTILVIEDERPLAEAIKTKFQKNDFEVVSARSVKEALGFLEAQVKVNFIWLDHYLLGKENGLDFVAEIKKSGSKWKNIPVYVVSNTASPDKVRSYLQLGVEKYYTKADYRLDQIVKDLEKHIKFVG